MKKVLLVLTNEIVTLLTRPSFWIATLGIPLMAAVLLAIVGFINRNAGASQTVSQVLIGSQETRPEGYVDLSGIIRSIPDSLPANTFIAYPDEMSARKALAAGAIAAFYLVPADYIQTGKIVYIRPDFSPLSSDSSLTGKFHWLLQVNMLGGDVRLANLVNGPLQVEDQSLSTSPQPNQKNPLEYWAPYAITLLFYMLIIGSATLLLSNVSKEKENRMIEMLLTSITSRELLIGKILGLGMVGLGQTVLWLGTSTILLNLSGRALKLPTGLQLPLSFVMWGLLFFILGYAVYASLMAGLGALAPNMREASQVTFIIILPLLVPLFLSSSVFLQDPNGSIATGLSLYPLTAPVAMMARLSAGGVPSWQPVLAAVLLTGTAVLIVRAVAGMFRAQMLLSGQGIKPRTYLQALFGKM